MLKLNFTSLWNLISIISFADTKYKVNICLFFFAIFQILCLSVEKHGDQSLKTAKIRNCTIWFLLLVCPTNSWHQTTIFPSHVQNFVKISRELPTTFSTWSIYKHTDGQNWLESLLSALDRQLLKYILSVVVVVLLAPVAVTWNTSVYHGAILSLMAALNNLRDIVQNCEHLSAKAQHRSDISADYFH